MARTSDEFDALYNEHGGDPWKCEADHVQRRLDESLSLLKAYVPVEFSGTILEIGPFHGHFTRRLLNAFHQAEVVGFEISPVAADALKARQLPGCERLTLHVQDALSITSAQVPKTDPAPVLVALEVLYYLLPDEREKCIANLSRQFPSSLMIISGPIVGGTYLQEAGLLNIFWKNGLTLDGLATHNFRKKPAPGSPITQHLCDQSMLIRRNWANQVSYVFRPTDAGDLPPTA